MLILHALLYIAGIVIFFATLPLVVELFTLSVAAMLPVRKFPQAGGASLQLMVVIPAHNEEQLISKCVTSVVDSSGGNISVVVVAHNCTDATGALAQAAGAEVLALNDEVGGKGTALNYAFQHALVTGADAVLVIDADSTVSPNLTSAIAAAMASGSRALQCRYLVANPGANARTRLMNLAFLGINVLRPRGRARLGLSCGIFGNGFALSAETLRRVPYHANSVVEDLEYHLHLISAGIRVDFLDHAQVLGEMPDTSAASSTQRARWEGGRMKMRRQWTSRLHKDVLTGRLRMIEPLLDLRSLPLATEAVFLVFALVLAFGLSFIDLRVGPQLWPLLWLGTYAGFGLCTLVLYIVGAALLGPEPAETLKALIFAPGYMFWKIAMIPHTRTVARKDGTWVRTQRNESPSASLPKD